MTLYELKYSNNKFDLPAVKEFANKVKCLDVEARKRVRLVLVAPNGVTEAARNAGILDKIIGSEELIPTQQDRT